MLDSNSDTRSSTKLKRRWHSIRTMYIVAFSEAFSNSIILTSMWSYLKYMDDDVETTVMGQLTGMQGLLALVSCIACGSVSSRIGCKIPLIITSIAALGSNIVYVIPYHIESQQITLVYISRALAGISGGCLAIARVYLSVGTTILERTTATSHFVAAQMLGYTVGPVLQMAYVPIGEEGFAISTMSLNVYTLPAVTNTLLVSLTLVCIFILFKEVHVDDITTSEITRLKQEDSASVEESSVEKVSWFSGLDIVVTVFLNLLFAATVFTFGVKSTVAAPYGMHILGWSRQLATRNFSMIMFTLAGLAIFVVMILGKTSKLIDERVSLSIGMVLTIISSVLLIPFGPGPLERPTIDVNGTSANNGEGGCPWKYSWCDSTPAMPVAQYVTALSIQGFGYPMLQSTAFFIYAKTLQPKHQGLCMGVFSAMGNIGRLTGSLYGGYAYFKYGVQWAFGSSCIIISTMGIGIILLYPRLIPYTERKKQKDKYEEECYL